MAFKTIDYAKIFAKFEKNEEELRKLNKDAEENMLIEYVKKGRKIIKEKGKPNKIKKVGEKLGCLVAVPLENGYSIGWSKAHTDWDKFDKDKAKEIAIGRALNKSPLYLQMENDIYNNFPDSFTRNIKEFAARCQKYYKADSGPINFEE